MDVRELEHGAKISQRIQTISECQQSGKPVKQNIENNLLYILTEPPQRFVVDLRADIRNLILWI